MGRQQRNAKKKAPSAKQMPQKSAESSNTVTRANRKRMSTTSGRGQNAQEKRQKTRSLTTEDIPAIFKAVVDALPASRQDGAVPEDGSTERGQQPLTVTPESRGTAESSHSTKNLVSVYQ